MSEHHVVHVEFSAEDRETAAKFYIDLFGWKFEQIPEMNYATFDAGDKNIGGGLNPVTDTNPPGTVMVYIGTDDIDASLTKAESLGAKIITPKTEIPNTGWFGFFSDPTGNMIGLYTDLESES
jgi:predicted enzyme related to lactoylglutathione lyase